MSRITRWWFLNSVVIVLIAAAPGPTAAAGRLQLLRNGGFEEDEMTFRGEPASSCGGYSNNQWFNSEANRLSFAAPAR